MYANNAKQPRREGITPADLLRTNPEKAELKLNYLSLALKTLKTLKKG